MSINSNNAIQKIQDSIDAVDSTTTLADLTMLAIAVDKTTQDREFYVNSENDLPNIVSANVPEGQIYFVDNLKVLVMSANNQWMGLDGRVLRTDGGAILPTTNTTIGVFGQNFSGQLGDGSIINKSSPVSVIGGFTDWCQVSAGDEHTAAVRTNGTLWSWGQATCGILGDGTTVNKCSPVSVIGGFTDWCQVAAGFCHNASVRQNGTLWTWGLNCNGRLGDGTTVGKCSPVSVIGGFTDWCQVSAGCNHTAAVRTNGTLWSWGNGRCGKLGDGTTVEKCSPVSVIGGFTDWCQVSAGDEHTAAVRQNGTLWSWGYNGRGQLGDGTTVSKSSPVSVVGDFTDWCQVSAGSNSTAAVRQNGTLWTWGVGNYGRLGDNTTTNKSSPVSVVGGFTDWCQVSTGLSLTLAVRQNGTLWSWGRNSYGNLGTNSLVPRSSPVPVIGGFTFWCQASAGCNHTAAIRYFTDN